MIPSSACGSSLSTPEPLGERVDGTDGSLVQPAASQAHVRQLVFAYVYEAVPELDAFAELGSRDFTIRECAARGAVIMPASSLLRPQRNVCVPTDQLPLGWQGAVDLAGRHRSPEYIWFQ